MADDLLEALEAAVKIADEAREEWDKAPSGMRAGKLLIALSGHLKGYRLETDAIHAALAQARRKEAATDLYEALAALIEKIGETSPQYLSVLQEADVARAALAKARGKV